MATTANDMVDHLLDFQGGSDVSGDSTRKQRRAILAAERDLVNYRPWTYLNAIWRLFLQAPYQEGTIEYVQSSRTVTLTGGTWPSWTLYGNLVINQVMTKVERVVSSTVIILDADYNFGQDLAAGTEYAIYQDAYTLPMDFVVAAQLYPEQAIPYMRYCPPSQWLESHRAIIQISDPVEYTIVGDPKIPGRMCVRFWPFPIQFRTIDFFYRRRPRAVVIFKYDTGTVSTVQGSDTVTLEGGMFTASTPSTNGMVGSILRVADDDSFTPTPIEGMHPYTQEFVIKRVLSETVVVVNEAAITTLDNVKYIVSDPIDINEGVMLTAFQRGCEAKLAEGSNADTTGPITGRYRDARAEAAAADVSTSAPRPSDFVSWIRPRYVGDIT